MPGESEMKIDLHATSTVIAIIGLLITVMMGAMWMGELSSSVHHLKDNAINPERIARIEERLEALLQSQSRLSIAIDRIAPSQEVRRPR